MNKYVEIKKGVETPSFENMEELIVKFNGESLGGEELESWKEDWFDEDDNFKTFLEYGSDGKVITFCQYYTEVPLRDSISFTRQNPDFKHLYTVDGEELQPVFIHRLISLTPGGGGELFKYVLDKIHDEHKSEDIALVSLDKELIPYYEAYGFEIVTDYFDCNVMIKYVNEKPGFDVIKPLEPTNEIPRLVDIWELLSLPIMDEDNLYEEDEGMDIQSPGEKLVSKFAKDKNTTYFIERDSDNKVIHYCKMVHFNGVIKREELISLDEDRQYIFFDRVKRFIRINNPNLRIG